MAMFKFKAVATGQLGLVCVFFLFGHLYRLPWAKPASACKSDLYVSVAVAQYYLFCCSVPAFMILFALRSMVVEAEAEADSLDPAADAVAEAEGEGVAAGWVRTALLLAVALSAAASFVAVVAFEDGYRYRRGCADGPLPRSPMAVVVMVFSALLHGFFAWVYVCV